MAEIQRLELIDDQPKKNPWLHDRLGFAPFAERVAQVITQLKAPNGFVIGLHGKWGSGKSTLIKFITSFVSKHNADNESDQITVIDFRPWIVTAHHDLIAEFFKVLSETIDPEGARKRRSRMRVAQLARGTSDTLVDAAATVAVALNPTTAPAVPAAGLIGKLSIGKILDRFIEEPSLQAAYYNLFETMRKSGKRILVTIDDIDRLDDDDVRSIMRMVKSIGQLPNVIYLLSYDREIVWQALDGDGKHDGPRYGEKIVQQELELPVPKRGALLRMLDGEIGYVYAPTNETTRWYHIITDGLERWIRSPRDVVRLSNAVKFAWPAIKNEIDPQDLLAMEGLKLFDTGVFHWVRDNRDLILGGGRFRLGGDSLEKESIADLRTRMPSHDKSQLQTLLSILFPQLLTYLQEKGISSERPADIVRRRGIASEAGYDAYFSLYPSSDEIPMLLIEEMASGSQDMGKLVEILRSYMRKKNSRGELMIAKLLEELRAYYASTQPAHFNQKLMQALFFVGEEIIGHDELPSPFQISPRSQLELLIHNMLERATNGEAEATIISAFADCNSPAFLADIYVSFGRDLGIFPGGSPISPRIGVETFQQLGPTLLRKIRESAATSELTNAPHYFDIVRAWDHLLAPDEPRTWLIEGMKSSAEFTAKAALGLVSRTIVPGPAHYTFSEKPNARLYDLPSLVEAAKKHKDDNSLNEDHKRLLAEIARGGSLMLNKSPKPEIDEAS